MGGEDIKDEGRCCEKEARGREVCSSSSSSREAEIAEKWGTLDKMTNGTENGYSVLSLQTSV